MNDRVRIADTVGDVVHISLLATRIKTIKQEVITVPNGLVLGSHIINYSSSGTDPGLILHSTITLGYDVPWRQAETPAMFLFLREARARPRGLIL